jgi:hypothetical protein
VLASFFASISVTTADSSSPAASPLCVFVTTPAVSSSSVSFEQVLSVEGVKENTPSSNAVDSTLLPLPPSSSSSAMTATVSTCLESSKHEVSTSNNLELHPALSSNINAIIIKQPDSPSIQAQLSCNSSNSDDYELETAEILDIPVETSAATKLVTVPTTADIGSTDFLRASTEITFALLKSETVAGLRTDSIASLPVGPEGKFDPQLKEEVDYDRDSRAVSSVLLVKDEPSSVL